MTTPIPVFAGPSLWNSPPLNPAFSLRPPAVAGDLIALLADPPRRLCLIDGLFDNCAAPWHKELLLLMAAGTRVYGAASMGALRAAELHGFGMVGVGAIAAAYRRGLLTGDDEVALAHGPAEWNWRPLSVPMVEVRATLAKACRLRLLTVPLARRVRRKLHDIPYAERDWPRMIDALTGVADAALLHRIAAMHVPLKQHDALACLQRCAADSGAPERLPAPPVTLFIRRLASSRGVVDYLPPRPPA